MAQITMVKCDLCGTKFEMADSSVVNKPVAYGAEVVKIDFCTVCDTGVTEFMAPILSRGIKLHPQASPPAVISPAVVAAPVAQQDEDFYHTLPSPGKNRSVALDPATRAPWALKRRDRGTWVQYPGMLTFLQGRSDLPQGPRSMVTLAVRRAYVADRRSGAFVPLPEMFLPRIPQPTF